MDVLAHTLWTNALFHIKYAKERRLRYIAAAFGVIPDLVGFVPLTIYIFWNRLSFDPSVFMTYDHWTFAYSIHAYNYSHSFVIFLTLFLLVFALRKGKFYWPMLGWGLHIIIDFFTHPDFFQAPILFPISDYKFYGGISWAHPTFMAINYGALILLYVVIFWYRSQKLKKLINGLSSSEIK